MKFAIPWRFGIVIRLAPANSNLAGIFIPLPWLANHTRSAGSAGDAQDWLSPPEASCGLIPGRSELRSLPRGVSLILCLKVCEISRTL